MNRAAQLTVVTAFGFVSSMAIAAGLVLLEAYVGMPLYDMSVFIVLPLGALLAGTMAASGYYFGALWIGHKPTKMLFLSIASVSVVTFFAIHWFDYTLLKVDGRFVREHVPFWAYLKVVLERQEIEMWSHHAKVATTGELGLWGYARAAEQIIGFALGGVLAFFLLKARPYCGRCRKYLKSRLSQVRYASEPESVMALAEQVATFFESNRIQEALNLHGNFAGPKKRKHTHLRSSLERQQCPQCHVNWVAFSVEKRVGRDLWQRLEGLTFGQFHSGRLHP